MKDFFHALYERLAKGNNPFILPPAEGERCLRCHRPAGSMRWGVPCLVCTPERFPRVLEARP